MAKSTTSAPNKKTPTKAATTKTTKTTKKTSPTKKNEVIKKEQEPKQTPVIQKTNPVYTTSLSPLNFIKMWLDGWKKTFVFSGRSSRLELWCFLLLNSILMVIAQLKCSYIMSERYLLDATQHGYGLDIIDRNITIAEVVFYLTIFIPLFPFISLAVRRLHDIGKVAWTNYFEPLFMSVVVTNVLLVSILELENTSSVYIALALSVCFIATLYAAGFHGLKILIMTMFYRGDTEANDFGAPQHKDEEHETLALNLSCLYFLFIFTIGALYLTLALI